MAELPSKGRLVRGIVKRAVPFASAAEAGVSAYNFLQDQLTQEPLTASPGDVDIQGLQNRMKTEQRPGQGTVRIQPGQGTVQVPKIVSQRTSQFFGKTFAGPKSTMQTKKGEQRVGAIPGEKFFHGTRTEIGEGGDYGGIHLGTRKAAHDRLRQTYWLRSISEKGRIDEATVNLKKTLGTKENPVDEDELFNIVDSSSKLKNLKAKGIDGIIYRNDIEDPGSISVLALNKSSISNYIKGKSRDEKKTLRDTYLKLYQGMED
jgi:hypothetical protein